MGDELKPCPFCGEIPTCLDAIDGHYCPAIQSLDIGERIEKGEYWNNAYCWKRIADLEKENERLKEPLRLDEFKGLLFEKDVEIADLEKDLQVAVEALENAIDVAKDAINQESGGRRPSYFDQKWGWTENIEKCESALSTLKRREKGW